MKNFKAVVFDVDGTLTEDNSWYAFTRSLGASEAEHLAIYEGQSSGQIGHDEAKTKILALWLATGKASKKFIEETFSNIPVREDAYPLIKWLQENKYPVCLITGSSRIYAATIAEKLGVEEYYANANLFFDGTGMLKGFHYDADQAKIKLEHLAEFCKKHGIEPTDCIAIGDGNNDIGLFRITGNGIFVKNDKASPEVEKAAWKLVSSLSEVRYLLES
ncbi:MAG: phosphoserine phosphatase SerB [Candidatus Saccharibacteria bacterium]|nr:phosphoserine phosphatase SerB [Candidatus Saccharibacteria bacterium]